MVVICVSTVLEFVFRFVVFMCRLKELFLFILIEVVVILMCGIVEFCMRYVSLILCLMGFLLGLFCFWVQLVFFVFSFR